MNLTVHSIGDSAFLAQILNSIAMIAGTADMRMAAGIGALVGLLFQAFKGLMAPGAGGLKPGEFLTSVLLWMALFQPSLTVTIEDAYSQEVRVVSHVPLGPAVAGSLVSSLGYGLTVLFETAFSVPSMTRHGYAGSLETLTAVRRNLLSRLSIGKMLDPNPQTDVRQSVSQYVKDCTLTGVDVGAISVTTLLNGSPLPEALRFDSEIYTTEIRDGGTPLLVTCTAAWPRLSSLIRGTTLSSLSKALGNFMTEGGTDPGTLVQSALDALTQGQESASDYILAAAIVPMFEQGVLERHQDSMKATEAAMVETAIAQRNTQWAAEQTLFTRIVRPMLTWIEGFSYAVTPIMAFTLMLGARGVQMCGQYALMLVWIQFWMPVLAIGNLYITLATQAGFAALNRAQFALDSIAGLYQMDMELQNWLAIGGMLASATPAIALMLVYGGSVTATHFLGRMQGGDFIDEKIGSPSLMSSPPLIGTESRHRHAPLKGVSMTGAESILPTFTLSQSQSEHLSQAESQRNRSSEAFMESLRVQGSKTQGQSEESGRLILQGSHLGSSSSSTDRFLEAMGQDLSERYQSSGLSGHDFATLLGGAVTGRIGSGTGSTGDASSPIQLASGLQAQLQDRFHLGESQAREIASGLSNRISHDHGFQSELAQSVALDQQQSHRSIASLGFRDEATADLGRSAQAAVDAETSYQQAISSESRSGSEVRIGAIEAGRRFETLPEHRMALDRALDSVGLRGDAERLGAIWQHEGLINDRGQATAAAGLALLTGHARPHYHPLEGDERVLAQTLGRTLLSEAFDAPSVERDLNPHAEAHRSPSVDADTLRAEVIRALPENPIEHRNGRMAFIDDQLTQSEQIVPLAEARIADAAANGHETLTRDQSQGEQRMAQKQHDAMMPLIQRAAETDDPAERVDGLFGAFLRDAGTHLGVLGEQGIEAYAAIMHQASDEGLSARETVLKLAREMPEAVNRGIERWIDGKSEAARQDLTPAQWQYYRAALLESFGGVALTGDYQTGIGDLGAARSALDREAGTNGPAIATILRKMAGGARADLQGLLRSYNGRSLKPQD